MGTDSTARATEAQPPPQVAPAGAQGLVAAPRAALTSGTIAALVALYYIWGSTYLAIRVALPAIPPLLMAGMRFITAGALLYGVLRLRGVAPPTRAQWRNSALIGTLLVTSNGLVCVGEQWVSSGIAAVIISSVPLWVALFSALFGSAPSRRELLGLGVGVCGVLVLNLGGELRGSPAGGVVLLASALCWGFGSILSRRVSLPKGLMASAPQMLCGGVAVLLAGLARGERMRALPGLMPALAFGYLVVFGSIVGYSAFLYLLGKVRPTLATSYAYVNPLVAVLLGALFLHEPVAPTALLALALILGGVALTTLRR